MVFLLCTLGVPVLLILVRADKAWPILFWLNTSFYCAFFMIFMLVHLEVRYFYLVKMYSFSMCLLLLALAWSNVFRFRIMKSKIVNFT